MDPIPSTPTKSSSLRIVSPTSPLIGAEGSGFEMVLHGMNAERCLLAGEAPGPWLCGLERATNYARERYLVDRLAIQHGLAEAFMKPGGSEANDVSRSKAL